jgi:hypothetical protein
MSMTKIYFTFNHISFRQL